MPSNSDSEEGSGIIVDPCKVEFLQYCDLALRGEAPTPSLAIAIETTRKNLAALKEDFEKHHALLNDFVQKGSALAVNEIVLGISAYASAVDVIEKYIINQDKNVLVHGMEMVRRVKAYLNNALQKYRLITLKLSGPTDMPDYNLLIKAAEDYQSFKLEWKQLVLILQNKRAEGQKIYDILHDHEEYQDAIELCDIYQKHLDLFDKLEQALFKREAVGFLFDEFYKTSCIIHDNLSLAYAFVYNRMPVSSGGGNFMMQLVHDMFDNKISDEYFNRCFQLFAEGYDKFKLEFAQRFASFNGSALPGSSTLFDAVSLAAKLAVELYDKGIARVVEVINTNKVTLFNESSALLEAGAMKFQEVYNMLSSLEERGRNVPCVKCGHSNSGGHKKCDKCGGILLTQLNDNFSSGKDQNDTLSESEAASYSQEAITA